MENNADESLKQKLLQGAGAEDLSTEDSEEGFFSTLEEPAARKGLEEYIKDDEVRIPGLAEFNPDLPVPEFRNDVRRLSESLSNSFKGTSKKGEAAIYDFWFDDDDELPLIGSVLDEGKIDSPTLTKQLLNVAYHYTIQVTGPLPERESMDSSYLKLLGIEETTDYPQEIKNQVVKQALEQFDRINLVVKDSESSRLIEKAKFTFADMFKSHMDEGLYESVKQEYKREEDYEAKEKMLEKYKATILKPLTVDFDISPRNFQMIEDYRESMTELSPEENRKYVARILKENFSELMENSHGNPEIGIEKIKDAAAGCIASLYSMEHFYRGGFIGKEKTNGIVKDMVSFIDEELRFEEIDIEESILDRGYQRYEELMNKIDEGSVKKHALLQTGIRKDEMDEKSIKQKYVRVTPEKFEEWGLDHLDLNPLIITKVGECEDKTAVYHIYKGINNDSSALLTGTSTIGVRLGRYESLDGKLNSRETGKRDYQINIDLTDNTKFFLIERNLAVELEKKVKESGPKEDEVKPERQIRLGLPEPMSNYLDHWGFMSVHASRKHMMGLEEFVKEYENGNARLNASLIKEAKTVAVPVQQKSVIADPTDNAAYWALIVAPVAENGIKYKRGWARILFEEGLEIKRDAITQNESYAPEDRKMSVPPSTRYVGGPGAIELSFEQNGELEGARLVYITDSGKKETMPLNTLPGGCLYVSRESMPVPGDFHPGDPIDNPAGYITEKVKMGSPKRK